MKINYYNIFIRIYNKIRINNGDILRVYKDVSQLLLNFSHLLIDVIVRIINLTFSTASFPAAFKSAVVMPLFKNLHLTAIF